MAEQPIGVQEIANREYIGPNKTGDNIDAQRVAPYGFDGSNWQRQPVLGAGLVTQAWDAVGAVTNTNVLTLSYYRGGLAGTLINTVTLTFTDSTLSTLVSIVKT
jgi:hypothetical protein